jgi:hypothetical protein
MPQIITEDDARYALDHVKAICTEVGPGSPGTPQERERAAMIQKELESHLGVDHVTQEEFTLAPEAFLGSQLISTLFMLIAFVFNLSLGRSAVTPSWLIAVSALLLSTISVLLFIFEFVLVFEMIDPIFKKKQSVNVIGTLRKPGTQNVKRLLMLSGHHDSAVEFNWLRFTGYGYFFLTATWLMALITVLVMSAVQLSAVITGHTDLVRIGMLRWILLGYPIAPSLIFAMFFHGGRKDGGTVPGAVDNLAASAVSVAMCRFLSNNPAYIPAETEIRFLSFGGEEAGVRGSRRYVERHHDELERLDARLLNFEMIAHPEITILTSETNGTVVNSPEMVKSITAAADRAGVPYKVKPATLGTSNDAGPFSRAGLKATTLLPFKFPQQTVAFYHQKWDTPDVLTIEPLLNVLKLAFEWICAGGE